MGTLICELCGGAAFTRTEDGFFRCDGCGCKYSAEQARAMLSGGKKAEAAPESAANCEAKALLERACAQTKLGEYEAAGKTFAALCDAYPDFHLAWAERLVYLRLDIENHTRDLNGQNLADYYTYLKNARATAPDTAALETLNKADDAFWPWLCRAAVGHAVVLHAAAVFRYVSDRWDRTAPEAAVHKELWDLTVQACIVGLEDGGIKLFGVYVPSVHTPDSLFDLHPDPHNPNRRLIGSYEDIKKLKAMHFLFARFCLRCREAADSFREGDMRLGFYFCELKADDGYKWQVNWIKDKIAAYQDLYLELDFLLIPRDGRDPVAFGTFCNHGCSAVGGLKGPFFVERGWLDIYHFLLLNSTDKAKKENINIVKKSFSGKYLLPCPYCGYKYVGRGNLLGRKCPSCKHILPKG